MGADFQSMELPGTLDRKDVEHAFEKAQADDRYENGHYYSGGFGMANGLEFPVLEPFASKRDGEAFLQHQCQKWEAALAVRFRKPDIACRAKTEQTWLIGAWCAS
jgi:hypothetical protein